MNSCANYFFSVADVAEKANAMLRETALGLVLGAAAHIVGIASYAMAPHLHGDTSKARTPRGYLAKQAGGNKVISED
jgi:hypothetical protein